MLRKSTKGLARQFSLFSSRCAAKRGKTVTPANETEDAPIDSNLSPSFFVRTIGANYRKWESILIKHPELKTVKPRDLENTVECLKSLQFNVDDILSKPMILYSNALTVENRHSVFKECSIKAITVALLVKYVTVMNRPVVSLKSQGYIPFEVDMLRKLCECFTDVELTIPAGKNCNENVELKSLRQIILSHYLRQRLDMSTSDLEKMWKVYSRVRHKSFKSVQEMIHILNDDLQFPKERIIKNAFLLHGDPDNVRRIVSEIPSIDGQDMREIVYRRPKILMSTCDSLKRTLEHVRTFGIGEDAVIRCLEVLTLGSDTVLDRLRDLHEIEEFQVLGTNPRVLRLVHYQNKARLRLEYLNQLKVRCASLHILSCGSEAFAKFARDGSDRTKGRDIVVYLANIMDKDENDIRNQLSRHPNWCHIPVIHIKQCYEYLLSMKFQSNDIYQNIHLLLYPTQRIDEKLKQLQTTDLLEEVQLPRDMHRLENREILTLILYFIESEFHFTGDGIWTEQHTQNVENFHNLLPDFPESVNKVYKYGVKPANTAEKFAIENR